MHVFEVGMGGLLLDAGLMAGRHGDDPEQLDFGGFR